MTEWDPTGAGLSRRHFLIASGAVGACAISVGVPTAAAQPGFSPPTDCGKPTDTKDRFSLWDDVKGATPAKPHPNLSVVVPDPTKLFGYAVKNGDTGGTSKYNLLFLPAPASPQKVADARISGVECPRILQADALNLWPHAWHEATTRFPAGTDVMLGINSKDGRRKDQLHIHLSALQQHARGTLNGLKNIPTDPAAWNTSMFVVMGNVYRILHVADLNTNLFALVHKYVANTGKNNDMFQQSIAVVSAPKGFYVLNTQGKPDTKAGQPEHNPQLRMGNNFGTTSIEPLIYRG